MLPVSLALKCTVGDDVVISGMKFVRPRSLSFSIVEMSIAGVLLNVSFLCMSVYLTNLLLVKSLVAFTSMALFGISLDDIVRLEARSSITDAVSSGIRFSPLPATVSNRNNNNFIHLHKHSQETL